MLGVATFEDKSSSLYTTHENIVFDNEKFNQDIFITITDADGNTTPGNYYIELETMALTDIEATMLTLQSIRQVMS